MGPDDESPPKRQKLETEPIDLTSDDDSPPYSPPAATLADETIATLPLNAYNPNNFTQPTQLLDSRKRKSSPLLEEPRIQVAASSPTTTPAKGLGRALSSSLAPAGTSYRAPNGVVKVSSQRPRTLAHVSDDDAGPHYMGGSSDEDESQMRRNNDIKPSKFITRDQERVAESPQAQKTARDIKSVTDRAFFQPNANGSIYNSRNRDATSTKTIVTDKSISAHASASTPAPRGSARQSGPARALPMKKAEPGPALNQIEDASTRLKVKRMQGIMNNNSVSQCLDALKQSNNNMDNAVELLSDLNESRKQGKIIDLTGSEDELLPTPAVAKMKQGLKAPSKSVWDKYGGATQSKPINSSQGSHGNDKLIPKIAPQPIKGKTRRLVRGPRHRSSSPVEPQPKPKKPAPKVAVFVDSSDSDEAVATASASESESFDSYVLSYFNTCSLADLVDTASIPSETAEHLISKRPFRSAKALQSVQAANAKSKANPLGGKIYDKVEIMLRAYRTVDNLVKQCETVGKPLAADMKAWGVDLFGIKGGEVDLVTLKGARSSHDSGIGTPVSELGEDVEKKTRTTFISQPTIMSKERPMKNYQVVGINWLNLLFGRRLSGILADDMGLGKTCQVIGFLAHLHQIGEKGPHLVVVPSSTIENWLSEFHNFCPELRVLPLYESQARRREIRDQIEDERDGIDVVITTYAIALGKEDFPFLKAFGFCCTIYDEGHFLRNSTSMKYQKFIKIKSEFRLLLTGTPLQNNLQELISLLAFLMPKVFRDSKDDLKAIFSQKTKTTDNDHQALLSERRIQRARQMLVPFILRRKKGQVLKDLPAKISRVEYCQMTEIQQSLYDEQKERARDVLTRRAAKEKMSATDSANILMRLRQAAMHPFCFRRNYKDATLRQISKACLQDEQWSQSNPDLILQELRAYSDMEVHQLCAKSGVLTKFMLKNDEWMISGKVEKLVKLLRKFTAEGHRTLIFSQFVMVMDILELVLQSVGLEFFRLDGTTPVEERQGMIDEFCDAESTVPIFMLSTKAGGAGINLAKANKVIIFDSGFNPQDDIQAENRAHRIGQEKEVEVVRLVTKDTIEEQIYHMGQTKIMLDEKVAGDDPDNEKKEGQKKEAEGQALVEQLLFKKLMEEDDTK